MTDVSQTVHDESAVGDIDDHERCKKIMPVHYKGFADDLMEDSKQQENRSWSGEILIVKLGLGQRLKFTALAKKVCFQIFFLKFFSMSVPRL